jgi:hypothetical protein
MKSCGNQIDPHLNKEQCDYLFTEKLIYGCGKPFQIIVHEDKKVEIKICHYI